MTAQVKEHRNRLGLRKVSPESLNKATDDNAAQVNRILFAFSGTAIFCVLSLLTPDSALLAGSEKLNVPFAGPVSFFGFIIIGPAVLIALRVYLQIYMEHGFRLNRLIKRIPVQRAPTLIPLDNPILRALSGFILYLFLPLTMTIFSWKAAAFPKWGLGLWFTSLVIIGMHIMLPLRFAWRSKALTSFGVALIISAVMIPFLEVLRRPLDLTNANLSGQFFSDIDLRGASLRHANLAGIVLPGANLTGADLWEANLKNADLVGAQLIRANLQDADFSGALLNEAHLNGASLLFSDLRGALLVKADLTQARLGQADLRSANLSGAIGLETQQLATSCGDEKTKLDEGLKAQTQWNPRFCFRLPVAPSN